MSIKFLLLIFLDAEIVQVMLCYESRNYLLCNLSKGSHLQMPLDLVFKKGTKIAFTSNGRGHVHLTGYLLPEEDLDDFDEMEDESEEEDETEEEDVPQLVGKQAKRKAQTSPAGIKQTKRMKDQGGFMESESLTDDSEDDLDAEDVSSEIAEDDSEKEEGEEEEEDSDEDDDEEEEVESKPQQKKNKQNKQQQQQQKNQKAESQKPQKQQNNLTNGKDAKAKQVNKEEQSPNNSQLQKKKVVAGGVQIEEIKVGKGQVAKPGKFVSVYYVGRLKNGKKFDATTNGDGFKFRLGKGEVIKGWDYGVQGMKVGGKRRITIPPAMAYV